MSRLPEQLYLWGGRGGKAMTPSSGELWAFDTISKSFSIIPVAAAAEGEQPEDRSFHVLTSHKVCPLRVPWRSVRQCHLICLSACRQPSICTRAAQQRAVFRPYIRSILQSSHLSGSSFHPHRSLDAVAPTWLFSRWRSPHLRASVALQVCTGLTRLWLLRLIAEFDESHRVRGR